MLNNQIIIADDALRAYARRNEQGIVDAAELPGSEWEELCRRNVNSPKAQTAKCAKCWGVYRETQWLQTFNQLGGRIVRHQRGQSRPDHGYEAVETPGHKAHVSRTLTVWDGEGYPTGREVWTPNKKARNDAVADGPRPTAYECQHSPFSTTSRYSAPERTRHTEDAGYTALWHTDNRAVRGMVPILRTDGGLPPELIENLNYRLEFRSGLYRIEIYTCTVRDGHECPAGKFSGCGKPHARGQVTAGHLDDVLRGAPVGSYMPVVDAKVVRAPKYFWTDRHSYDQYLTYIAGPDSLSLLDGSPADQAQTRSGVRCGHSRLKEAELEAMRAQAVDLAPVAPAEKPFARPRIEARPVRRCPGCDFPLVLPDGEPYPECWRCDGAPTTPVVEAPPAQVEIEDVPVGYAAHDITAELRCAHCGRRCSTTDRTGSPLCWGCPLQSRERGRAA